MKLRNINPIGQVDLPLIGRQGDNGEYAEEDDRGYAERTPTHGSGCLEPGEEFDVTEDQARQLLAQPTNYEPADDEARQLLDQLAAEARAAADLEIRRLKALANSAASEAASAARAAAEAAAAADAAAPPAATSNEGTA